MQHLNTMNSGIYKITNKNNGKFYLGSSKNLIERWNKHQSKLKNNSHVNPKLQHAWNYHGKDAFEFTILEHVSEEKLYEREQYYLDTFKPYLIGYNIGSTSHGGDTLSNHPDGESIINAWKERYSVLHKGEGNPMFGKSHTQESIDKQKQAAIGRFSLEWFIERNGIEEGTIKYNNRREKLKTRKMNYSHDNGLLGTKVGPMSDENKRKISESKKAFKLRKPDFFRDLKSGQYTIEKMAELYNTSKTLVKYYKRKR
jgi:group I intron endonuclease